MTNATVSARAREAAAALLVIMAEHGIAPDFGEVLLQGNPQRGIKPGALFAMMKHFEAEIREECAQDHIATAIRKGPQP